MLRKLLDFGGSKNLFITTDFLCLMCFSDLDSLWTYLSFYRPITAFWEGLVGSGSTAGGHYGGSCPPNPPVDSPRAFFSMTSQYVFCEKTIVRRLSDPNGIFISALLKAGTVERSWHVDVPRVAY